MVAWSSAAPWPGFRIRQRALEGKREKCSARFQVVTVLPPGTTVPQCELRCGGSYEFPNWLDAIPLRQPELAGRCFDGTFARQGAGGQARTDRGEESCGCGCHAAH